MRGIHPLLMHYRPGLTVSRMPGSISEYLYTKRIGSTARAGIHLYCNGDILFLTGLPRMRGDPPMVV